MIRVLFDHQIFTDQTYGGISRYFAELIKNFDKTTVHTILALIYSENNYLEDTQVKYFNFFKNKTFKGRDKLLSFFKKINRKKSIRELRRRDFDVFHPTYYSSYFLDHLANKPFVITIYDMIHELYSGKYFGKNEIVIREKKKLVEMVDKIIAISENTKKDIVNIYDISPNKIDVVYLSNSLDPSFFKKINVPSKFLLFVGGRGKYKNFNNFIKAILSLLKKNNDLSVICVGGGHFTSEELLFLKKGGVDKQVFQKNVTDEELVFLYKKTIALVFPSEYEGFGLPIIEAFACSCPVILSDASCFPEIAQDAAMYFQPTNVESIRCAIEELIKDDLLRKKLINLGIKRGMDFSWKKAANKTSLAYKSIL